MGDPPMPCIHQYFKTTLALVCSAPFYRFIYFWNVPNNNSLSQLNFQKDAIFLIIACVHVLMHNDYFCAILFYEKNIRCANHPTTLLWNPGCKQWHASVTWMTCKSYLYSALPFTLPLKMSQTYINSKKLPVYSVMATILSPSAEVTWQCKCCL